MDKDNEWFVGEAESEGGRIVSRGRLFRVTPDKSKYKMRVEIVWQYKPDMTAMPLPDETVRIDDAMNTLCDAMEKDGLAFLTAIHIGAGYAIFVYYTRSIDVFSFRLDETLGKYPVLPIKVGAAFDESWSEYRAMLTRFSLN